ncbi:ferritin-like fold-containing protein [Conyzicola sp.]|uniref:ferritin-like fold-containing protein n=1 Tax=Conyzicola sp. TaxID=1969404 RepID=UPI003988BDD6
MVNWFSRTGKRAEVPRLRPRSETEPATKVDLAELTPDLLTFLGKAAYLQLTIFENLGRAMAIAPTTEAKEVLSRVAALSLAKHHGLTAEIRRHGEEPGAVMQPFTRAIDDYQRATQGGDWFEELLACHITAGFLDDFFVHLAAGLPSDYAARVTTVLRADSGAELLADELRREIEADDTLDSRLAMWGRRLVGDTMLVARATLAPSAISVSDEARIEPVFTELIAAHTRRMDGLGLTA